MSKINWTFSRTLSNRMTNNQIQRSSKILFVIKDWDFYALYEFVYSKILFLCFIYLLPCEDKKRKTKNDFQNFHSYVKVFTLCQFSNLPAIIDTIIPVLAKSLAGVLTNYLIDIWSESSLCYYWAGCWSKASLSLILGPTFVDSSHI